MKLIKAITSFFKKLIARYKRARLYAKALPAVKKAYELQLQERKKLVADKNAFLYDYFGIDAKSKFIPKDFKNAAEVKEAIMARFGKRMEELNVKYSDLFS